VPPSTYSLFILNLAIITKYIFFVGDDGLNSQHGGDVWSAAKTESRIFIEADHKV
jgi:hypothetical protein